MRLHITLGLALVTSAFVLFFPVLIHAHWGLFDDPSLILQSSRRLMDDPSTISYILAAQMRMGIYYWVTVIWRLFPENPTGFFATNFVLISTALIALYSICFKLTQRARLSFLCTTAVLASPSLFEVIYTLDKQEVYFPLLCTAVILSHLLVVNCKIRNLPLLSILCGLCSTACYLSKETGAILCLFSGAILFSNLVARTRNVRDIFLRFGSLFFSTLVPLLVLKFLIFPVAAEHYVTMTFDIQKLLLKTSQYVTAVPDFFLILACCCVGGIWLALAKTHMKNSWQWCAFISLLFSSVAATGALISFDTFATVLIYIWLPIYFFLLPCFAYVLRELPRAASPSGSKAINIFIASLLLLLATQLPIRFLQAQFQFSFDALTGDLAKQLSAIVTKTKHPIICAMPTYSVGETEIPERIETHVRNLLQKRYYETKSEKVVGQRFSMLNFLSADGENKHLPTDPASIFRLAQFRGRSLTYTNECPKDYVGWSGFQILNGSTPFQEWVRRPYGKDDLLIVPYGEVSPDTILYRGAGIFAHPWQLKVLNFPQLIFKEIGHVERKLYNLVGHRQTIGWRIFQVTSAESVALDTSTDGWLANGKKIHYRFMPERPILRITSKNRVAPSLAMIQPRVLETLIIPRNEADRYIIDLPLAPHASTGSLQLRDLHGDSRVHVDEVHFVTKSGTFTTPFITRTFDGWLFNHALIVYAPKETGKVLVIETTPPGIDISVTSRTAASNLHFDNGKAKILLADGKSTADGLLYLELSSSHPVTSVKEPRQLLIHCDAFRLE